MKQLQVYLRLPGGKIIIYRLWLPRTERFDSFSRSMPVIECNMWDGMNKVLDYLWEKGHRRIALVTPYPMDSVSARNLAWCSFMKERGGSRWKDYFLS